jgi:predicted deacetylase
MRSNAAQYLLRFDDLCPTMSRERWKPFRAIITRHGLRPIFAVVPDNQDPDLKIDNPDPQFWDRMRTLETEGATIAMHGYQHLCASSAKSMLGLHRKTEFAGIDEQTQRKWIREGLEILRGHGLSPRLFVAPRHGFDRATLSALAAEGLGIISDGFATRPFTRENVVWIPQQLWEPVNKSSGLWTICIHSNTARPGLEQRLDSFLHAAANQFVSLDDTLQNYVPSSLRWNESLWEWLAIQRLRCA